jgi:BirA family transcriptional regulator, biotin operon repressor / biotin---[acetyl-CoA-carboxylase] ligase
MSPDPGRPARAPLGRLDALASTDWAPWPTPEILETTPSTMVDVESRASAGAPEGTVVVAEEQTAGRGRRGRTWESSARAGLWWSLLLRPRVTLDRIGWLPLVVGIGVARGLRSAAGVDVALKWPNDVLVGGGKIAGILAERLADGSVVVGVGINIDQDEAELPEGGASLRTLGSSADRTAVLLEVLTAVAGTYREWMSGRDMRDEYVALSATVGRRVAASLGSRVLEGHAERVGPSGELVVVDAEGHEHLVSAGDVTLLRAGR